MPQLNTFVTSFVLLNFALAHSFECPTGSIRGFTEFPFHTAPCYLYERFETQFVTAERMCGHLASITDGFINAFVAHGGNEAFLIMEVDDFWVGGQNLEDQSKWNWVDGERWGYTLWDQNQPSNEIANRCTAMKLFDGKWRAENCFDRKPYVCELGYTDSNKTTIRPTTRNWETTTTSPFQTETWMTTAGELETTLLTTKKVTTEAATTKEVPTTTLTTEVPTTKKVTTEVPTTKKVTTEVPTTFQPTTKKVTTEVPTTKKVTTEVPTTFQPTTKKVTTEAPTTKKVTTEVPTTFQPTTKKTTTEVPTTLQPTTEVPTTKKVTTEVPTTTEEPDDIDPCPEDWLFIDESVGGDRLCYRAFPSTGWNKDKDFCEKQNGSLVSLHNNGKFIKSFIFDTDGTEGHVDVSIGLTENVTLGKRKWFWLDGSPVDYENWIAGYPKIAKKNEAPRCATYFTDIQTYKPDFGKWKHVPCNSIQERFVCQKKPLYDPDPDDEDLIRRLQKAKRSKKSKRSFKQKANKRPTN